MLAAPDEHLPAAGGDHQRRPAALAPKVTHAVRDALRAADPTLDADVAAWFADDCPLPRLTLLGPVTARTRGAALTQRKPYMTEILAYLATRPHGATPDQLAHTMRITRQGPRLHEHRAGLAGHQPPHRRPRTCPTPARRPPPRPPGSGSTRSSTSSSTPTCSGACAPAASAAGPDGIDDLDTALTLVRGRPFDQLREGGWAWLHEGDRLDQHLFAPSSTSPTS